jgi:hypothetical protein
MCLNKLAACQEHENPKYHKIMKSLAILLRNLVTSSGYIHSYSHSMVCRVVMPFIFEINYAFSYKEFCTRLPGYVIS